MSSALRFSCVLKVLSTGSKVKRKNLLWSTVNMANHTRNISSTSIMRTNKLSYIHNLGEQPLKYLTIGQCLENAANLWPDRPYVVSCEENLSMTFSQVLQEADKLSAGLISCGLKEGDRVGVCSPNSTKWLISMMAAARAGFILVTINPAYTERELEYCLNKVGVKCMIMPSEFKTQKYYEMLRNIAPELNKSKPGDLQSQRIPTLKSIIIMDNKELPGTFTFNQVNSFANSTEIQNISSMQKLIRPDSGCNIQYTSGTTGKPKAALMSHFNFVNNSYLIGKRNQLSDKHHKICTMVPFFHAYGIIIVIMASLQHGTTMVLPSPSYNPERSLQAIAEEKCTVLTGTPTMYVDILNKKKQLSIDLTAPEIAVAGGSPCSPQLFEQIKNELNVSTLKSVFGMTETTAVVFQSLRNETIEQATQTVGHVQEHIEIQVVDPDGRVVPFGSPGELWIRGYSNMLQYWEDEAKSKEIMGPDRWLKTGDKFVLHENGYGQIIGRLKDVIIRGGENIFPKEIEDYLNTHPGILESQVFGVSDDRLGEEVCAGVRLKEGAKLDHDDLKAFCKGKLSHFKIPRYLKIVDSFPKTTSGKIQKFKLRKMFENGSL